MRKSLIKNGVHQKWHRSDKGTWLLCLVLEMDVITFAPSSDTKMKIRPEYRNSRNSIKKSRHHKQWVPSSEQLESQRIELSGILSAMECASGNFRCWRNWNLIIWKTLGWYIWTGIESRKLTRGWYWRKKKKYWETLIRVNKVNQTICRPL